MQLGVAEKCSDNLFFLWIVRIFAPNFFINILTNEK